jgi:hypothetical protein
MLQPETVERDKYGFWLHSVLLKLEEDQPIDGLPEAEGMEFSYVEFFSDAPEELTEMYDAAGDPSSSVMWEDAVRAWQPTPPEGEGWFLIAVYDTEDGPYACFARPQAAAAGVQA